MIEEFREVLCQDAVPADQCKTLSCKQPSPGQVIVPTITHVIRDSTDSAIATTSVCVTGAGDRQKVIYSYQLSVTSQVFLLFSVGERSQYKIDLVTVNTALPLLSCQFYLWLSTLQSQSTHSLSLMQS